VPSVKEAERRLKSAWFSSSGALIIMMFIRLTLLLFACAWVLVALNIDEAPAHNRLGSSALLILCALYPFANVNDYTLPIGKESNYGDLLAAIVGTIGVAMLNVVGVLISLAMNTLYNTSFVWITRLVVLVSSAWIAHVCHNDMRVVLRYRYSRMHVLAKGARVEHGVAADK
jgi:hypothetical protein